jgi:hypothetical protein
MSCANGGNGQNGQEKECSLSSFERNKFFYGKLMTVRDFNAEQSYFNEKRRLINRLINGIGIVCGLEISETKADTQQVTIEFDSGGPIYLNPGVALDCWGREIVVPAESSSEHIKGSVSEGTHYLYLSYKECPHKKVPAVSNPSGCDEVCCDTRIVEEYQITVSETAPHRHPLNWRETIDWQDGLDADTIARATTLSADINVSIKELLTIDALLRRLSCNNAPETECNDPKVLLGVIVNGAISKGLSLQCRSVVTSNPMLYGLINSHLKDFDNPHNTTADQVKALKTIHGVGNTNEQVWVDNVDIVSPFNSGNSSDGKIIIDRDHVNSQIKIEVANDAITTAKVKDGNIIRAKMGIDVISGVKFSGIRGDISISPDSNGDIRLQAGDNITITPINPTGRGFNATGFIIASTDHVKPATKLPESVDLKPVRGTSKLYARGDHVHDISKELLKTIASTDHVKPAAKPPKNVGITSVTGDSEKYAREDHVHGIPIEVLDALFVKNIIATTKTTYQLIVNKVGGLKADTRRGGLDIPGGGIRAEVESTPGRLVRAMPSSAGGGGGLTANPQQSSISKLLNFPYNGKGDIKQKLITFLNLQTDMATTHEDFVTKASFTPFNKALKELSKEILLIENVPFFPVLNVAAAQEKVCIYAMGLVYNKNKLPW